MLRQVFSFGGSLATTVAQVVAETPPLPSAEAEILPRSRTMRSSHSRRSYDAFSTNAACQSVVSPPRSESVTTISHVCCAAIARSASPQNSPTPLQRRSTSQRITFRRFDSLGSLQHSSQTRAYSKRRTRG
jgi:hypothetical protein